MSPLCQCAIQLRGQPAVRHLSRSFHTGQAGTADRTEARFVNDATESLDLRIEALHLPKRPRRSPTRPGCEPQSVTPHPSKAPRPLGEGPPRPSWHFVLVLVTLSTSGPDCFRERSARSSFFATTEAQVTGARDVPHSARQVTPRQAPQTRRYRHYFDMHFHRGPHQPCVLALPCNAKASRHAKMGASCPASAA